MKRARKDRVATAPRAVMKVAATAALYAVWKAPRPHNAQNAPSALKAASVPTDLAVLLAHNVLTETSGLTGIRQRTGPVVRNVRTESAQTDRMFALTGPVTPRVQNALTDLITACPSALTGRAILQDRTVPIGPITTGHSVQTGDVQTGGVQTGSAPTGPAILHVRTAPTGQTITDRIARTGVIRTDLMLAVPTDRAIPRDQIVQTDHTGMGTATIATSITAGIATSGVVTGIVVTTMTGGVMTSASAVGRVYGSVSISRPDTVITAFRAVTGTAYGLWASICLMSSGAIRWPTIAPMASAIRLRAHAGSMSITRSI